MKLQVKRLRPDAKLPTYGSGGCRRDGFVCLPGRQRGDCARADPVFVHGLAIAVPQGYAGLVFARSGMACKHGLAPANKVGVIDADYRGEVKIALHNHGPEPQRVEPGDRVAQLVIVPVLQPEPEWVEELPDTQRGSGGFGSTGRA